MSTAFVPIDDPKRRLLVERLATLRSEVLGVSSADLHDEFFFLLGGTEEMAGELAGRLTAEFRIRMEVDDIHEASTLSKLADLVQIRLAAGEQQCVVPIRPAGSKKPLFVIHGIGGNVLGFAELARTLDPEQPVYGIQAQALAETGPTLVQLEAMAGFYVEQMKQVQPAGPYAFLGLCFGGLVAYEMAQQLAAQGEAVQFIGLLDTRQPGFEKEILMTRALPKLAWMRLRQIRRHTRRLSLQQWLPYVQTRLKSRMLRLMYRRIRTSTAAVSLPDSMRRVKDINLTAALRYKVKPFPGKVTLFRAEEDVSYLPEDFSWRRFALGGVEVVRLPGDHGQMLAEPSLSAMAAIIQNGLEQHSPKIRSTEHARDEFDLDADGLVPAMPESAFSTASFPTTSPVSSGVARLDFTTPQKAG